MEDKSERHPFRAGFIVLLENFVLPGMAFLAIALWWQWQPKMNAIRAKVMMEISLTILAFSISRWVLEMKAELATEEKINGE